MAETTEALKEWEAAARRVKGMFREFGWPERLTFTEAVAEQLVLMTYLPNTTAQEPSAPIAPVVDERIIEIVAATAQSSLWNANGYHQALTDTLTRLCALRRGPSLEDGLRRLLRSYAQPCEIGCEHSQCPLLRELYNLQMKAVLERARSTVGPIVDKEKRGEQVGDLMNMRLDSAAPASTVAPQEQSDELAQWSSVDNWPLPDVLNKLADATEYLLNERNYDGDGWEQLKYAALAARNHIKILTATTSPSTVARKAAREWMNTHHGSFETNQAREDALVTIIERCLAEGADQKGSTK